MVQEMEKIQFDYFHGLEGEQYTFYRIPKLLFTAECFQELSCEAKVLYGLFLDRMSLSVRNHWIDEESRVYIIFTVDEIASLMNCGVQKAVKLLKELDHEKGIGLIEKKRFGLGKPNVIYVKNFMVNTALAENAETVCADEPEEVQNCENHNSRTMKTTIQEREWSCYFMTAPFSYSVNWFNNIFMMLGSKVFAPNFEPMIPRISSYFACFLSENGYILMFGRVIKAYI